MKTCALSKGMNSQQLLFASRLQQKQAHERKMLGLSPSGSSVPPINFKRSKEPKVMLTKNSFINKFKVKYIYGVFSYLKFKYDIYLILILIAPNN